MHSKQREVVPFQSEVCETGGGGSVELSERINMGGGGGGGDGEARLRKDRHNITL